MADYSDLVRQITKKWFGIFHRAGISLREGDFPQRDYNAYVLQAFDSRTDGPYGAQALSALSDTDPRKAIFQLQLYAVMNVLRKNPVAFALNNELNAEFRDLVYQNDQYGLPLKTEAVLG